MDSALRSIEDGEQVQLFGSGLDLRGLQQAIYICISQVVLFCIREPARSGWISGIRFNARTLHFNVNMPSQSHPGKYHTTASVQLTSMGSRCNYAHTPYSARP